MRPTAERKVASRLSRFSLVLATLFAVLFLGAFFHSRTLKIELEVLRKVNRAYELYVTGNPEFEKFVRENGLRQLGWLAERFSYGEARRRLDNARSSFQKGNYGDAIRQLGDLKDSDVPWLDEVYYLLGVSYERTGQVPQARFFLSAFINGFKDSVFRREALLALLRVVPESEQELVKRELEKLR